MQASATRAFGAEGETMYEACMGGGAPSASRAMRAPALSCSWQCCRQSVLSCLRVLRVATSGSTAARLLQSCNAHHMHELDKALHARTAWDASTDEEHMDSLGRKNEMYKNIERHAHSAAVGEDLAME